ncbi:MAG: SLC13 family permease [Gemmatimonadales bacterium]
MFLLTYLLIALQRFPGVHLNRPAASLLGAVAMVTLGGLPLQEAYAAIDLDVLVFLLGVMILVGYLEEGGFFEWCAAGVLRHARTPARLLVAVTVGSGLLSAFFVNDTVCLMLTPVLIGALVPLGVSPVPYLIALAMGANVGSALTFAGNPQVMLIGMWSGIPFGQYALGMLPVVGGGLVLTTGILLVVYRQVLSRPFPADPPASAVAVDRTLVVPALALFAGAVVGWLLGFSLPLVAISAGAMMVALARRDPAPALARVEWTLVLFFAALFVVMRGLEYSGAVNHLDDAVLGWASQGGEWRLVTGISGAMLALSNLVSNVPAVILWRNVVPTLPDPELAWRVMAMSSTFAGNLLLIGSMANLIVAERAEARGVTISFSEYARVGIPVTLATLVWGVVVMVWLS